MTIKIIKKVEPKKKYLVAIMIGVCLIFANIIGCGNSSNETIDTTKLQEETTEETPAVEEDAPEAEEITQTESDKIFVGDTFTAYSSDGSPVLEATVLDAGTTIDNMLDERIVYVELDIKNLYNEELVVGGVLQGFYGDDYLLDSAFPDDSINMSMVAPGRKVKGRLCAFCPDYDQYNVIEMEYAYRSIVIKDPSMESSDEVSIPENPNASSIVYGTYVFDDTVWENIGVAEVGFNSGDGVDTIHIEYKGVVDQNTIIEFNGIFEPQMEDGTYIAHCTDYYGEIWCTFSENGLNIEVADIEFDEGWDLAGYYELESKLNIDEVS